VAERNNGMIVKKCEKCKTLNNPKKKTCFKCGASLEGIKDERIKEPWHFWLVVILFMLLAMGVLFVTKVPIYWLTIGISASVNTFLASLLYRGSSLFSKRDKEGK
jgi:NADH:ubiquinone oxidoreductase subunit 3 (subunit A)